MIKSGDRTRKLTSYRDLRVWRRAMDLCAMIYRLTSEFPDDERFGLVSQMRRAAVSIPSNVAEGQGRLASKEFLYFLGIARGSLKEIETQVLIAAELDYIASDVTEACLALTEDIGRMLSALIRSVRDRGSSG